MEWDFSFAQSCANPYVDLNLSAAHVSIAAKCRTMAGGWLPTTIEAYPCWAGGEDIANSNGHLTCDGGTPAGSYTGSCAGISLAGTTLTASCADLRGARARPVS